MLSIFGVTVHSLAAVYDRVCVLAERHGMTVAVNDTTKKANIVIINGFFNLKKAKDVLSKQKVHVIVLDNPLLLANIVNLIPLDFEFTNNSYRFTFKKLDWNLLNKTLQEKTNKHVEISEIDHIAQVINKYKEGAFLDNFNTFTLCLLKDKQVIAKRVILSYIFGKLTKKQYEEKIPTFMPKRKSLALEYYEELKKSLEGEDGKKIIAALKDVSASKGAINYKKISKNHNVQASELRYLFSIWTKINAPAPNLDVTKMVKASVNKTAIPPNTIGRKRGRPKKILKYSEDL